MSGFVLPFEADLFNNYNISKHRYTFEREGSEKTRTMSLEKALQDYKDYCPKYKGSTSECDKTIANMRGIYGMIKDDVSTSNPDRNEDERSELKRKLQSMHSETGILASQHSDYMSVVMSSVLWTTLAGGLIVYAVIKSRT
jgi:hypothetical protein